MRNLCWDCWALYKKGGDALVKEEGCLTCSGEAEFIEKELSKIK